MTPMILSTCKAENSGGFLQIEIMGTNAPMPSEKVEIKNTADALTKINAYAERVKATGKPAVVSARIPQGFRKPAGFAAATKRWVEVNLDA